MGIWLQERRHFTSRRERTRRGTVTIWMSVVALLCTLMVPLIHAAVAKAAPALPDKHPEYTAAVEALHNARKHLEKADADGYGHRDRAMRTIERAIDECNQAVEIL